MREQFGFWCERVHSCLISALETASVHMHKAHTRPRARAVRGFIWWVLLGCLVHYFRHHWLLHWWRGWGLVISSYLLSVRFAGVNRWQSHGLPSPSSGSSLKHGWPVAFRAAACALNGWPHLQTRSTVHVYRPVPPSRPCSLLPCAILLPSQRTIRQRQVAGIQQIDDLPGEPVRPSR